MAKETRPGQVIKRFDGGITSDGRESSNTISLLTKGFDIFSRANRLVPRISQEIGDALQTTHGIRSFIYYNSKVYGLGISEGSGKVYERSDFTGSTWTASTNGAAGSGAFNPNVFVEYQSFFYGWKSAGGIFKFDPSGSAGFNDSFQSTSGIGVQGLVHSKDDVLYLPYNVSGQGIIASLNVSTYNATALTLPKGKTITCVAEYGNYLAIACKAKYSGTSTVYLWDRDSSLTTLADSIDFGTGDLNVIGVVDGYLIGVSISGASADSITPNILFRRYSGGTPQVFRELVGSSATGLSLGKCQIANNRLYFLMGIELNGIVQQGVWEVGRSNSTQEFGVNFAFDPTVSSDSAISSLTAFKIIGDYLFAVYNDGADKLSKTNESMSTAASYNVASVYESKIFDDGDASLVKKLVGVSVTFAPLPENGQIVLKYKRDSDTSWTTIFTEDTDNEVSHSSVNIESNGNNLGEYKELKFRVESTGGAEITSASYVSELTGKRRYD